MMATTGDDPVLSMDWTRMRGGDGGDGEPAMTNDKIIPDDDRGR